MVEYQCRKGTHVPNKRTETKGKQENERLRSKNRKPKKYNMV